MSNFLILIHILYHVNRIIFILNNSLYTYKHLHYNSINNKAYSIRTRHKLTFSTPTGDLKETGKGSIQ